MWFKSDEGQLKVWYDDGVGSPSSQWVDTSNNAGGGTSGGGGNTSVEIGDTVPSVANNGDLWWKSDEGRLKIYYDDGQGSPSIQWVDATPQIAQSGYIKLTDLKTVVAASSDFADFQTRIAAL